MNRIHISLSIVLLFWMTCRSDAGTNASSQSTDTEWAVSLATLYQTTRLADALIDEVQHPLLTNVFKSGGVRLYRVMSAGTQKRYALRKNDGRIYQEGIPADMIELARKENVVLTDTNAVLAFAKFAFYSDSVAKTGEREWECSFNGSGRPVVFVSLLKLDDHNLPVSFERCREVDVFSGKTLPFK